MLNILWKNKYLKDPNFKGQIQLNEIQRLGKNLFTNSGEENLNLLSSLQNFLQSTKISVVEIKKLQSIGLLSLPPSLKRTLGKDSLKVCLEMTQELICNLGKLDRKTNRIIFTKKNKASSWVKGVYDQLSASASGSVDMDGQEEEKANRLLKGRSVEMEFEMGSLRKPRLTEKQVAASTSSEGSISLEKKSLKGMIHAIFGTVFWDIPLLKSGLGKIDTKIKFVLELLLSLNKLKQLNLKTFLDNFNTHGIVEKKIINSLIFLFSVLYKSTNQILQRDPKIAEVLVELSYYFLDGYL
jgi:hypothetical protein